MLNSQKCWLVFYYVTCTQIFVKTLDTTRGLYLQTAAARRVCINTEL